MRLVVAVFAFALAVATQALAIEHSFPYRAYVTSDEVYVRSGPGQSYYPTDKLRAGQEVEIYRHDPGGWYAIRPADGSFSWVSGKFLKPENGNLAMVTDENVAARVGSRFSDVRDVIQVRLHKGEWVEMVEEKPAGAAGEKSWVKIAPPSGEFRWIFGKYVDTEYPGTGLRKNSHAARGDRDDVAEDDADRPPPWPQRKRPGEMTREEAPPERERRTPAPRRTLSPEEFQNELMAIELELSTMIAQEPAAWSLDQIGRRAEMLLDQADTALERGRARILTNKIAWFADIKYRSDALASVRDETQRWHRLLSFREPADRGWWRESPERTADRPPDPDRRFDGTGVLTEVLSPRAGSPRYALVDQQGEVRTYVSPAPGVNLRGYVGRPVGITGTRGYMPEQRAQHLMARHVSLLGDRVVR